MAIILADIITEYGAYYLKSQQNVSRLVKKLRIQSETDQAGETIITDETVYQAAEATVTELLQPWQKSFTPKGDIELVPAPIYMKKMKIDKELYPDDLEGTWLNFLASDTITDRKMWPFMRWMLEEHLVPQMAEDWETKAVFKGVFAAPTVGVAGAASTSIDGIKKIINNWITAGRITPIATGAPSIVPADWVGQVEDFVDAISEAYYGAEMQLNMSYTLFKRFVKGMRAVYGKDSDFDGLDKMSLKIQDNPLITVKGLHSMAGSDKIWMTPKANLKILQKRSMTADNIHLESQKRVVNVMIDFWKGVGFLIPEIVFTNDQDLV